MKVTNEKNLPKVLVDLAQSEYEYVEGRYSVTELLNGTKEIVLKRRYHDQLEIDVSRLIGALFGTAFHHMIEMADAHDRVEQKIEYAVTKDFTLSGRYDRSENFVIEDYKTTRVSKWIKQDFEDYKKQGLMYAWIERRRGNYIDKLRFYLFFKDYVGQRSNSDSYPRAQVEVWEHQISSADIAEIERFIMAKWKDIARANLLHDDQIAECSPIERWNDGDKFAVIKKGAKRATAVYDDLIEAKKSAGADYVIETRPGKDMKCEMYCDVKEYCHYWRNKKIWLD